MRDYLTPEWEHILRCNDLDGFDALWEFKAAWFEPLNEGRGGWSGVARIELDLAGGAKEAVFLKRQENHTRRTLRNPLFGEPTFAGEIKNILLLRQAGVSTLEPLYYAQRKIDGNQRAILVTRELVGFRPLDEIMNKWAEDGWGKNAQVRKRVLTTTAGVIRRMHEQRLVHNALYPKHIFVRLVEGRPPEVAFIDLEKMRRTLTQRQAMRRDLDSLNRRARSWSNTDRLRFIKSYLKLRCLNRAGVNLWRYLARRKKVFMQKGIADAG